MYEDEYLKENHFSFGRNWQNFLNSVNPDRINEAKRSLLEFLGGEKAIKGKTFLDIGCGSGLFSLAAYLLGAKKVMSVDVDKYSVGCARLLAAKNGKPDNWKVVQGSVLDLKFLSTLGKYDVVYSWGVLHHTGKMYQALDNVFSLANKAGVLYIAIYNRYSSFLYINSSEFWWKVKRIYNKSGFWAKKIIETLYIAYHVIGLIIFRVNPVKYIRDYKKSRGMSWKNDVIDWLGGYPYEFATPDEIVNYCGKNGYLCKKMVFRNGTGCNEYLLVREQ